MNCWNCGHYAFGCFKNGEYEKVEDAEYVCDGWVPENTPGTVSDFELTDENPLEISDKNEYLKDDMTNL